MQHYNLNTSYVTVKLKAFIFLPLFQSHLNTSYVTVKQLIGEDNISSLGNLNTSYVTVKPPYFTHSTFI